MSSGYGSKRAVDRLHCGVCVPLSVTRAVNHDVARSGLITRRHLI